MKKLFMASMALGVFSLAILLFQTVSCRKATALTRDGAHSLTSPHPVEGLWIGSYNVNNDLSVGDQYISLTIKPDSTLIVDSRGGGVQHLAVGTWSLDDSTFRASYTYVYGLPGNTGVTQKITAKWSNRGKLNGEWNDVLPGTWSGNIKLDRLN